MHYRRDQSVTNPHLIFIAQLKKPQTDSQRWLDSWNIWLKLGMYKSDHQKDSNNGLYSNID